MAEAQLLPFAVDHAIYLWNYMPHPTDKLSPLERFTGTLVHTVIKRTNKSRKTKLRCIQQKEKEQETEHAPAAEYTTVHITTDRLILT